MQRQRAQRFTYRRQPFAQQIEIAGQPPILVRFPHGLHGDLATLATRLEASKEFTYRVGAKMQAGIPALKEVSMAKNFATETSDFVTYEAVQIFGGMGYMRESLVERLYRDNRIASIGGGTYEIMNEIISKQIGL